MNKCFLLLGSNLGDKLINLRMAAELVSSHIGRLSGSSKVYVTEAWGNENQDSFLNQVILVETRLNPFESMHAVLQIEKLMGRTRNEKWEPRVIDIDILLFNDEIIETEMLTVPHPRLYERRFALVPLNEIAPDLVHPQFKLTISELLDNCSDDKGVEVYQP